MYKIETFKDISFKSSELLPTKSAFTRLIYAKTCPVTLISNEREYALSLGDSLLIPPFSEISVYEQQKNGDTFSLLSYFLLQENFYIPENDSPILFDTESELSQILGKYFSFPPHLSFNDKLLKKSAEYYIIHISDASLRNNEIKIPEKMLPIILYIENNYGQNFSIKDLAKVANISESAVYKQFTACMKESPKQYIRKRRMHHATLMLMNSSKTISDIAIETGFYDQFYFSKEFKKDFGISPSVYRKEKIIDKL